MEWNQHVLMILLTAVMLVSLLALCYAFTLYRSVRKEDAGNRTMQELSGFIHEGAMAFLKREYRIIIIFIIIVAAVLAVLGVLIAISRVVTGVHYISDVLAGLAFGSVFAVLGWNAFVLAASALGFYAIMLL